jgi:rare lipoprotein A
MFKPFKCFATATALGLGLAACDRALIPQAEAASQRPQQQQQQQPNQQRSSQEGEASYYGSQFNGRQMANGERFNPNSNSAAHPSLPLGTTAQVTNLENGRSATVKVEDRGPYARKRVIDVSPRTAEQLGMKQAGHAPVRVTPIEVPERDARPGREDGRQARR